MKFIKFNALTYQNSILIWIEGKSTKNHEKPVPIAILVGAIKDKKFIPIETLTSKIQHLNDQLDVIITREANLKRAKKISKHILDTISMSNLQNDYRFEGDPLSQFSLTNTILIQDLNSLKSILKNLPLPDDQITQIMMSTEQNVTKPNGSLLRATQSKSPNVLQREIKSQPTLPSHLVQFSSLEGLVWERLPEDRIKFRSPNNPSLITTTIHTIFEKANNNSEYFRRLGELNAKSTDEYIICEESLLRDLFGYKRSDINLFDFRQRLIQQQQQQQQVLVTQRTLLPERSKTVIQIIKDSDAKKNFSQTLIFIFPGMHLQGITWAKNNAKKGYLTCIGNQREIETVSNLIAEKLVTSVVSAELQMTYLYELVEKQSTTGDQIKLECSIKLLTMLFGAPDLFELTKTPTDLSPEVKNDSSTSSEALSKELNILFQQLRENVPTANLLHLLNKITDTSFENENPKQEISTFTSDTTKTVHIQTAFLQIRKLSKGETNKFHNLGKDTIIGDTLFYLRRELNEVKNKLQQEELTSNMHKKYPAVSALSPPLSLPHSNSGIFNQFQYASLKQELLKRKFHTVDELSGIPTMKKIKLDESPTEDLNENFVNQFIIQ